MTARRNDPCPCGSGEKFKKCCDRARRGALSPAALVLALLLIGGAIVSAMAILRAPDTGTRPGRVWSEEHGHWHETGTAEPAASGTPAAQPPGPAPPGKVWSPEHGHWHDAK
jgi:hypothetical protein